jgi:hypothetical protein
MKFSVAVFALLSALNLWSAEIEETLSPDTLVWCGLDYSLVKMIGTDDFRKPEEIFPDKLDAWNSLFMKEMLPKLEKMAPSLRTDMKAVQKPNSKVGPSCIVREDGTRAETVTPTHVTDKDIAAAVTGYDLKYKEGMGLVFIMDRLVKAPQTGCHYVVFFDIASRKVVYSERVCAEAGGAGFRNYWFKPIKETVEKLPAMYRKAKASPRS